MYLQYICILDVTYVKALCLLENCRVKVWGLLFVYRNIFVFEVEKIVKLEVMLKTSSKITLSINILLQRRMLLSIFASKFSHLEKMIIHTFGLSINTVDSVMSQQCVSPSCQQWL